MKDIKMLTRETIPCWYELSFRGTNNKPGILLRIHSDFVNSAKEIPANAPLVIGLKESFQFKKFNGRLGEDFGFENSLIYRGMKDGFLEYEIPTPLVRKFKDEICIRCNSSGYDEVMDANCLLCENGKIPYYDWEVAFAVSATISLLLHSMRFPEYETTAKIPQLMIVEATTIRASHGGSLYGEYGCELAAYLRSRPVDAISEMIDAMRIIHERMEGKISFYDNRDFQAYTQGNNGWLNISCPGDRCGLYPVDCRLDRGYRFSCHNVDQPIQQLTLLASLAALHDLARAAIR